jgi:hypothetical protein
MAACQNMMLEGSGGHLAPGYEFLLADFLVGISRDGNDIAGEGAARKWRVGFVHREIVSQDGQEELHQLPVLQHRGRGPAELGHDCQEVCVVQLVARAAAGAQMRRATAGYGQELGLAPTCRLAGELEGDD